MFSIKIKNPQGSDGGIVNTISNTAQGMVTNPIGTMVGMAANPIGEALGQTAGAASAGIMNAISPVVMEIVNKLGLNVTPGDIQNIQQAYQQAGGDAAKFGQIYSQLQAQSQQQLGQTQQALGTATQALGSQGQALDLAMQQATGKAASPAMAQLQAGTDQAIRTQQAMANSGNLSQMIGGQKAAMDNAALLQQQSANQAAQVQANLVNQGISNFGNQATAANQAAQGLAAQQANLYNQQLNAANATGALGQQARGQQLQGAEATAAQQLEANKQNAAVKAQIAAGIGGGLAGMASQLVTSGGSAVAGLATGGKVVGEEVVEGDSEKNDIVPVKLSAGEIVIPKSAAKSKSLALKFVEQMYDADKSDDKDNDGIVRPSDKNEKKADISKMLDMLSSAISESSNSLDEIKEIIKARARK